MGSLLFCEPARVKRLGADATIRPALTYLQLSTRRSDQSPGAANMPALGAQFSRKDDANAKNLYYGRYVRHHWYLGCGRGGR